MAAAEQIQPLVDLLMSMSRWAIDSMKYIDRRNHLTYKAKQDVQRKLVPYVYHLNEMVNLYRSDTKTISADAVENVIEHYQLGQSKMNRYGWFYEFPRYPLPDSVPRPFGFDYTLAKVTSDELSNILYEDDELLLTPVYSLSTVQAVDLIMVTYRRDYKHPRKEKIGWFKSIDGNTLILQYNRPRLERKQSDWAISMHEVVHIHKVKTISRKPFNHE